MSMTKYYPCHHQNGWRWEQMFVLFINIQMVSNFENLKKQGINPNQ
jgi:hypothetical protein